MTPQPQPPCRATEMRELSLNDRERLIVAGVWLGQVVDARSRFAATNVPSAVA